MCLRLPAGPGGAVPCQHFRSALERFRILRRATSCALFAAVLLLICSATDAATVRKANNNNALNKNNSWSTGVPTSADIASWDSLVTSANTAAIGGNLSWLGIQITNPGGLVTINGTAGRTLTLGSGGINMSAATQNLNLNAAIMLGAAQTWDVAANRTISAAGIIGGGGRLTKAGAGTLSLTGVNTYTNGTIINGGIVQINTASSLGASTSGVAINSATLQLLAGNTVSNTRGYYLGSASSTIQVDTGSTFTLSGTVANYTSTGSLVKTGAGTLILSAGGANTYGGAGHTTAINGGILQVANDGLLGNSANTISFNGGTLQLSAAFSSARSVLMNGLGTINTNNNSVALSGVVSGTGALTKAGAGTLTLSGNNTFSGGTTVSGGSTSVLSVSSASNLGTGTVTLNGGSELMTTGTMSWSNGAVLGAQGGSLQGDGRTVSGRINTASGTTLTLNGTGITETTAGTGRLEKTGAGTLVMNTANNHTGGTYIHEGVFVFGNTLALGPQPSNDPSFNQLTIDNGAELRLTLGGAFRRNVNIGTGGAVLGATTSTNIAYRNGVLANVTGQSGGVTVASGVNGFGGNNTFTGSVIVQAGAVAAISRDANLGAAANQLFLNGGTLRVEDGVDITGNGGTSTSTVLATFTTNRQINLGAGTNTIEVKNYADTNPSFDTSTSNPVVPAGGRPASHMNTLTVGGAISGAGALVKAGDGTLVLTNTGNSYSGGTIINGGVLSSSDPAALGLATSSMTINPTGVLQATGSYTTSRAVSLGGSGGANSGGTLDITSGAAVTRSGVISGTGSLTKIGSGTLTLSGVNTYTGETFINSGRVNITNNQALGQQPTPGSSLYAVHLANGVTLGYSFSNSANSRQVELAGGAATVDVAGGFSQQQNGLVYGAGGLIKTGAGTQLLTNANTYSGGTTINGGVLQVNNSTGSGTGSGAVTVNSGGTLSGLPTAAGFAAPGTISGSVAVNSGGTVVAQSGGTFTFGGLALNAGALTTFHLGAPTDTPAISISSVNGLSLSGPSTVSIINLGGLGAGSYRLFDYSGTALSSIANLQLGSTPGGGFSYSLSNNTTDSSIDLLVSTSDQQWAHDASGNWSLATNWTNGVTPNAVGAQANFFGAINNAQTVTVDGAYTVGTMTFDSAHSYTIAASGVAGQGLTLNNSGTATISVLQGSHTISAPLTLANNLQISAKSGTALDLSGVLSGGATAWSILSDGSGSVTLSGSAANTYSGLLTVSAGTLNLNKNSGVDAVGTGGLQVDAGATTNLLASQQIADAASLTVNGTLALVGGSETVGALSGIGNVSLGEGRVLTIGASNNLDSQFDGVISGAGTISKTGAGTLALTAANTFGGAGQTVTLTSGSLQVSADQNLGHAGNSLTFNGGTALFSAGFDSARSVVLASSGTFNTNNNSATLSGVISGAGALTKAGAGTLTLSGNNTYSGGTQITGGSSSAISISSAANVGSGAVTISGGSMLTGTSSLTLSNGIVLGATGGSTQSDGSLVSGIVNVAAGSTLTVSGTGISELTSGGGRLEKTGDGTLYVNTANSYSGGTFLHGGTLVFANSLALGPQPLDSPTQNALTISNGAHLVLALGGAFKRNVYIGNGGAAFGALDANTVAFRNGVISNVAAQSGGVTSTSGTNGFGGANTFSGNVVVSSGSAISMSRDVNLGAAANEIFLNNNSTLKIEDGVNIVTNSAVQATFSTSRGINLVGGQATIEVSNTNNAGNPLPSALAAHTNTLTADGLVAGSGGLVKSGAGTLILGNSGNSYSGGTTINAGTLSVGDNAALGGASGALTINPTGTFQTTGTFTTSRTVTLGGTGGASSGGTFDVTSTNAVTRTGTIDGTGSLTKTGTGTLSLLGSNSYTGGTYIDAGTVAINSSSSLGSVSGAATIGNATLQVVNDITSSRNISLANANSTMNVNAGASYSLSGTLSGSGVLNKAGDGVLALTGTNTYTGGSTINGGTVVVNSGASLGNGGALTLNAATLNVATGYTTSRNMTLGNAASTIDVDSGQAYTASGVLSGSGALNKHGSGTLMLTTANTFTGATTVNAGTLTAASNSGSALGTTSAVVVNSGGTLLLGASNQVNNAAPVTLGGGTIAKDNFSEGSASAAGLGALTLTANSILNFGTGTVGVLSFAGFTPGVDSELFRLTVDNWTGQANTVGTASSDRLIFNSDQTSNLSSFSFTGYADGATQFNLGGGYYEIAPMTPVPEPSTYAAAALAAAVIGQHLLRRRRRQRLARSAP